MSIFTELEHPQKTRWQDFVFGAFLGLIFIGILLWLVLPAFMATILGNSSSFDRDLRQKDAYMQTICTEVMDTNRDQQLCGCVLATEVPSLDCQPHFLQWSLDRYGEACTQLDTRKKSLSFCSCITTIAEQMKAVQAPEEQRQTLEKLYRCMELEDVLPLPQLGTL